MFAIVKTGGKQYRVQEGDILDIEKLDAEPDQEVNFGEVLAVYDDQGQLQTGQPTVDQAQVKATVLEHGKGKKVLVFKYKPKTKYRKKTGHRQHFTRVRIDKIASA